jgi:hypothetical protein
MIYVNLKTSTLRSPAYVGAEPVQRATWLSLLAYCCEQENGGRIAEADAWKDRQWQQTCGVTLAEVQEECGLWRMADGVLIVEFYPADKQAEVQHNREVGRRGGKSRSQAKIEAAKANGAKRNPSTNPSTNPSGSQAEAKQQPNGKERKGIGIGKEDIQTQCAQGFSVDQVIEAGRMAMIPPEVCRAYHDDRAGAGWLDGKGRPVASMPHDLSGFWRKWQSNRNPKDFGAGASANGKPKPEGVWQLKERKDAIQSEMRRIQNDEASYTRTEGAAWEKALKPDAAAALRELKEKLSGINAQLRAA